jgi:hypothetical protein
MDQYLVIQGNARFYCPPEQADYWASQGCTVYAMQPVLVAGEERDDALPQPVTSEPHTEKATRTGNQDKSEAVRAEGSN